ncbi:hypothetical protein SEA_BOGOTA_78 [Streptomyces phage Bogota]|nr:hypothetical protein SEA_UNTPL_78 [Streptomyces phage UNTPL]WIC89228.1 hypothetical protein SEA_BOGOTA_78 [Streptomyces phage Bogota]
MAEYETSGAESPRGQWVEFREYLSAGHSPAERRCAVAVSGKIVHNGWVSDGKSYAVYRAIVAQGLAPDADPLELIRCGNCGGEGGGGSMDPDVWIRCEECKGRGWTGA